MTSCRKALEHCLTAKVNKELTQYYRMYKKQFKKNYGSAPLCCFELEGDYINCDYIGPCSMEIFEKQCKGCQEYIKEKLIPKLEKRFDKK